MPRRVPKLALLMLLAAIAPAELLPQDADVSERDPVRIFISVDMEGIGGIGTPAMTRVGSKDYDTGRQLMTAEVNAVVEAILETGPAEILVNDSHGDMQNLRAWELDPRVRVIQGNIKPLGMVQGLETGFDAAIFLGYHARAGVEDGFLAHTGSGSIKGVWINDVEVGEGGLNAYFAGSLGVPVVLAAGDSAFAVEIRALVPGVRTVVTKRAVGSSVARMVHPMVVREALAEGARDAVTAPTNVSPLDAGGPVEVRMRFATTTRADIVQAIPGVERVDGTAVSFAAADMDRAYRMIRLFYKYITW